MKQAFDPEEIRPLILAKHGNVAKIAKQIKADSEELRRFILLNPACNNAMNEVMAIGVDKAVAVLFERLGDDDHFSNQLAAAKEFLKSRAAQRRGFHHAGDLELKMPRTGALTLTWLPPGEAKSPPMIEGTVETGDD